MNTSPTSAITPKNDRTEFAEVKVKVVVVNGVMDTEASLENFHKRLADWVKESTEAKAEQQNEAWIKELSAPEKIAEASAKVLSLFGARYAPRDFYVSQVLSSLTTSDGVTGMHPDLYLRVRTAVDAWLKAEKESGRITISKGKSGGVKAVESDLAHAAE